MTHEEIRHALAEHCTFRGRHVTFDTHEWRQATLPDAIRDLLADRDRLSAEVSSMGKRAGKVRDALFELLEDTQHLNHPDCEVGYCPVRDARQALRDWDAAIDSAMGGSAVDGNGTFTMWIRGET